MEGAVASHRGLVALCILAIGAITAVGTPAMIPAPTDLWSLIQTGGFFGLLVLIVVAFVFDWVRTTKSVKAQFKEAVDLRDGIIKELSIEVHTFREARSRTMDRTDRLTDNQESLTQLLNAWAAQKKPSP